MNVSYRFIISSSLETPGRGVDPVRMFLGPFNLQENFFQIGEVKVPLCMVDLAQTIEEWKDIQSVKVDDQVQHVFNKH